MLRRLFKFRLIWINKEDVDFRFKKVYGPLLLQKQPNAFEIVLSNISPISTLWKQSNRLNNDF